MSNFCFSEYVGFLKTVLIFSEEIKVERSNKSSSHTIKISGVIFFCSEDVIVEILKDLSLEGLVL